MVSPPFHPDDAKSTIGPAEAFVPGTEATPNIYALQHHLALEVVAFLEDQDVPFHFRGGTALHTKLPTRRRFSIDVDITTSEQSQVHDALKKFADRFPKSKVSLREPPAELKVDGVRYTLDFESVTPAPLRILVEVVEGDLGKLIAEPLRLVGDGFDWGVEVNAPTFDAFTAQKLAVLGPNTIGKPVGPDPLLARSNQGVCKQIFDLRELMGQSIDGKGVREAYELAVAEGNALRESSHAVDDCLQDAVSFLRALRGPRLWDKSEAARYGLWSGFIESVRWIPATNRAQWTDRHFRIAGGSIARLAEAIRGGEADLAPARRPVLLQQPPEEVLAAVAAAQQQGAAWFTPDFGGDAMIAWAWAPKELW